MEIRKIKLLLVMLCSGFSMLGLASDDMEGAARIPKRQSRFRSTGSEVIRNGEFYEGMRFAELDSYIKDLLGIPLDTNIVVMTSDDQSTRIEPTKYPYKSLKSEDVENMLGATVLNVHSVEGAARIPKKQARFRSTGSGVIRNGEFYEGMSFAELDSYIKELLGIPLDTDIAVMTSGNQSTYIEPTRYPDRFLEGKDVEGMMDSAAVNVHSRRLR